MNVLDLGDLQLGAEVPVNVQCTSDGHIPALPTSSPVLSLFQAGTLVIRRHMAADNQVRTPGLFRLQVFLNDAFTTGPVNGFIQWMNGGNLFTTPVWARIIPGGNASGSVIAAAFVRRPAKSYIVWEVDRGDLLKGSNPTSQR